MKTIANDVANEIVIKNSRFIALLIKIDSLEIEKYLAEVKHKYPKATHYCYAYVYNNVKHFSDDGEPGGTAGMPILNVIEKENLNNVLCIVVRYFGGIKLGAGGLVRAYTKSVTKALKLVYYKYLEEGYKTKLSFQYDSEKQVNYILRDAIILEKRFEQNITYTALVPKEFIENIKKYDYELLEKIYREKEKN